MIISPFSDLYARLYQATGTMTNALLSQITKFTLSDYYTVNVATLLTFLLWLC